MSIRRGPVSSGWLRACTHAMVLVRPDRLRRDTRRRQPPNSERPTGEGSPRWAVDEVLRAPEEEEEETGVRCTSLWWPSGHR